MKKFILNVLSFLFIVSIFNFLLFSFSREYYFSPYEEIPDITFNSYVFADSHGLPLDDFVDKYNVYNFSYGSESYLDIKRKINFLITSGYQVDSVYISVDDHTLSQYRENMNNVDRSVFYLGRSDFSNWLNYFGSQFFNHFIVLFQPKIRDVLKSYIYNMFSSKNSQDTPSLSSWADVEESRRLYFSERRINGQFPSESKSLLMEKALIDIISLSVKHDFILVGIKFPLSRTFVKAMDNKTYGADKIFLRYDVPVLDYKKVFIDNDDYFKDPDHLNAKGGEVFSRMLFSR